MGSGIAFGPLEEHAVYSSTNLINISRYKH